MSLGEFELIARYFSGFDYREGVSLGVGDDCALLNIPDGYELAVTTDTLNEGVHFFENTDPYLLGYKTLAVNVSDIAAMGAKPFCTLLSLSLKDSSEPFLKDFSLGYFDCAKASQVDENPIALVGGNISKGPLSFTVTAFGLVKKGQSLRRSKASVGDDIYVTGSLGLPAFAVALGYGKYPKYKELFCDLYKKSMMPSSRNLFAAQLLGISSCAIDISDGVIGDLKHILSESRVGANIELSYIPYDERLKELSIPFEECIDLALGGGGDYELLFTSPKTYKKELLNLAKITNTRITKIGEITNENDIKLTLRGIIIPHKINTFEHFYSSRSKT